MAGYFDGGRLDVDLSVLDRRQKSSLIDRRGESLRALADEKEKTFLSPDDDVSTGRFLDTLGAIDVISDAKSFYGDSGLAERDPRMRAALDIATAHEGEFADTRSAGLFEFGAPVGALDDVLGARGRAKQKIDDEFRGTISSWFRSLVSDEEASGGEYAAGKARERLAELRKLPNADVAALDRLEANLDYAFSLEGKARRSAELLAAKQYNDDVIARGGIGASMLAGLIHIADDSRRAELAAMILTAPVGFKATIGGTAARFAGLGAAIGGVEEVPRAYNSILEAEAYELGEQYKSDAVWDAVKGVTLAALFEGALGGALKGAHLGVGRLAEGGRHFQGAQKAWREWSGMDDVRQARQAHSTVSVRESSVDDVVDNAITLRFVSGDKPVKAKSGFAVSRSLTPDNAAEQAARGVAIETRKFANARRFAPDEFDNLEADANIGKTLEGQGVDVVVETGGDRRVAFLNPRQPESEPPVADDTPKNPDGSETDSGVAARGGSFVDDIPFEGEGGRATLPMTEDTPLAAGAIDRAAISKKLTPEAQRGIAVAEETDAILRAADPDTPRMDEIYAVQGGRVVMRNDLPVGVAEQYRLTFATREAVAPGIIRAVLDGRGSMLRSAFQPPSSELAARAYMENADRFLEAAVGAVRAESAAAQMPAGFGDLASSYSPREVIAQIDKLGDDGAREFFIMRDLIEAKGLRVEDSPLARGDLDYAFAHGKTPEKRAEVFVKLQAGHKATATVLTNTDAFRNSLLKNLEGVTEVAKQEAEAKKVAGVFDDVGDAASAKLAADGRVELTRIDGARGFKPGYRLANKGGDWILRRHNVDTLPKTDNALVDAVRRGEWGLEKKDKAWVARYKEIPKRPFITFLLTGGQSITDRRAWRGASFRGLALPPKTKFGRGSKTNRGWGELGIDVETLRRQPGLINNKEGLTLRQMSDFLTDGGELADIIEHNFPEVLTPEGGHNYDAVEDGLYGIFRRGIEADIARTPLLDKADDEFLHGDAAAEYYQSQEIERLAALGYEPRDPILGTRDILAREGISYLDATEDQIIDAHKVLEAEGEATRALLEKLNAEGGFDAFRFYEENRDAVDAAFRARGYEVADDGVSWQSRLFPDDKFDTVSPSSQLADAVLKVMRAEDEGFAVPPVLDDAFRFADEFDDAPPDDLEQLGSADAPPAFFDDIPPPTAREILEQAAAAEADEWATIGLYDDALKGQREAARTGSITEGEAEMPVREPGGDDDLIWESNGWRILDDGDGGAVLFDNNGRLISRFETTDEAFGRFVRDQPNGARDNEYEVRKMVACLKGVKK